LIAGLARAGWDVEPPRGTMFVWAPIPAQHAHLGSLEFALKLAREADVAVAPGVGFGEGGEGHVRFALVENEERIRQATRNIRRLLGTPHHVGAPSEAEPPRAAYFASPPMLARGGGGVPAESRLATSSAGTSRSSRRPSTSI